MPELPYGSCVSWRIPPAKNGFFEKVFGYLQNAFTNAPETHASMIMSKYPELPDTYYEYELSVTARINDFKYNPNSTVFDILAPTEVKVWALDQLIKETYGDVYGLLQTIVFAVRWTIEKFGGDGRRIWNPFPWLGICSEGMYRYLYYVADNMHWADLVDYLEEWSPDVFHAGDARLVLEFMVEKNYAKIIKGI